ARVYERWRIHAMTRTEHAVHERLEHMRYLAKKARKEGAWAAARGFEKEINLILGVYAPEKHAVQAAVAVLPAKPEQIVSYPGISDEALAAVETVLRAAVAIEVPPQTEKNFLEAPRNFHEGSEE